MASGTCGESSKKQKNKKQKTEKQKTEIDRPWYKEMQTWTAENGTAHKFENEFRISRETFNFVYESIKGHWPDQDYKYPPEERVAMVLWLLANGATIVQCEDKFKTCPKFYSKASVQVYEAIEKYLKERYLQWPEAAGQAATKKEFEDISGIPNIIGSLYTTRLRFKPDIRLRINSPYLLVQGVVDSKGEFIHVFCRHDVFGDRTHAEFFSLSGVSEKVDSGNYIVGGSAYVLEDKLLVPYFYEATIDDEESHLFNKKLGLLRAVARETFEELVGRWSFLNTEINEINVDLSKIPRIVQVCCILHNICKKRNDKLNDEFLYDIRHGFIPPLPGNTSESAVDARNRIAADLSMLLAGTYIVDNPRPAQS